MLMLYFTTFKRRATISK